MCRAFAASGLFAVLAFVAVTAAATALFSRGKEDTPGGSGGLALVVVFLGSLVALWPRGSGARRGGVADLPEDG